MSNNKMDEQEERWGKRNKEKDEIQQLYEFNEKHFDQGSEAYGQLIAAVENYSSKAIWAVLNNSPYNTREDYEDVIMRGRESFLQENNNVFFNYKNKEDVRKTVMFSDYARGMYQKKAFDHIKKRKRNSEVDPVPEDIYIENGYNNQIPSAGEVLIDYYAKAVMNSDANPFHIIFLCYSKMLPVVLGETRCNSADGWAWEHMQGKTMFRLSDLFVRMFNSAVRMIRVTFGKPYCDKLEKPFKDDKTGQLYEKLGEVILTSLYEQSNTKNWVARLNKKIMVKVVSEIMNAADSDEDAKRAATEAIAYTIGR